MDETVAGDHLVAGLGHLLAVSGLHAGLLALMLHGLLLALRLPPTAHGILLGGGLVFYALLTGLRPPVVRAVGACLLAALAGTRGRIFDAPTAMAATAAATALLSPRDLASPGFVLSYAAVAGIVLLTPWFMGLLPRSTPVLVRRIAATLAISLGAFLATAPLTLGLFGQAGPWSVPATPLLIPLAALLLGGSFLLAAVSLAGDWPATLIAMPLEWTGACYIGGVRLAAALPGSPLRALPPPGSPGPIAVALAGALLVAAWPARRTLFAALILAATAWLVPPTQGTESPRAFPAGPGPAPGGFLRCFAVGHGLACLVRTASGHTVLWDCGSMDRPRPGWRLVGPGLRRTGVVRLDDLVVTHADADHINGVPALLVMVAVRRLWLPVDQDLEGLARLAAHRRVEVRWVGPGEEHLLAPGVLLLGPAPGTSGLSKNDRSLALRVTLGAASLLLLGDQEDAGLDALLAWRADLEARVLLSPHHGRACRRTWALLERVTPELVLVSDGVRFGPSPEEPTYRAFGAGSARTAVLGELTLATRPDGTLELRTWR